MAPPLPDAIAAERALADGYSRESEARLDVGLREMADFMADGEAKFHEFRHPPDVCNSLENFISEHALDLDRMILRKGRSHALVCTKNDNSNHRLLDRRDEDEKLLVKLAKL